MRIRRHRCASSSCPRCFETTADPKVKSSQSNSSTLNAVGAVINNAGPLTSIGITADLNCSVNYAGGIQEFYSNTACGTFVVVGSTLYGPSSVPAGTSATPRTSFTPVSQVGPTGLGIPGNPFTFVTTVTLGTSGVRLQQTDTYVIGNPRFTTDVVLTNTTGTVLTGRVYRAGDCYVAGSDSGFGTVTAGKPACVAASGQTVTFEPVTSGSTYIEADFDTVWTAIGARGAFPNTCECALDLDNGAGLSWPITIAAGATTTVSSSIAFERPFAAVNPGRILDTRPGGTTSDSLYAGGGLLATGSTLALPTAGRGGSSNLAVSAILNVTAVATDDGYLTVFPCGSPRPNASNLNFVAGQTIANSVLAKIGTSGQVCFYVYGRTHLIVDLNGFYNNLVAFVPLDPARLADSRAGGVTIDNQSARIGVRPANSTTEIVVAGRGGVLTDAPAVGLNVTVTDPTAPGYITVWPCGAAQPNSSNVNFSAGQTIANAVSVPKGTGGKVCVFTSAAMNLIVDVNGYFPTGTFTGLVPARLLDTRPTGTTVDGQSQRAGTRPLGSITRVRVTSRGGVSATAAAVAMNVTVTGPAAAGYLTVWPCGATQPNSSNLNYVAGDTIANAAFPAVGTSGEVCIFNSAATQLIVDVNGFFGA